MKMNDKAIRTLFRSPLWAILPEAFSALLMKLSQQTEFAIKPAPGKVHSSKVAVVPIEGVLTKDGPAWLGSNYKGIANALESAAADASIKRIVLAVDSTGGEVTGLAETAEVIRRVANTKPVHAVNRPARMKFVL